MTPQELKSSILQLAVQGRLVEQRPEEGTAEELYRQIQDEKQRLIKEGKIKKEKPLPEITEDEVPFDIPESWKWVRLGCIGDSNIGLTYRPSDKTDSSGTIVLRSSNIQKDKMDYNDLVYVSCDVPNRAMIAKGDILICARNGSRSLVGKSAIVDKDGMAFGAFMAKYCCVCNPFVKVFLDSPAFRHQLDGVKTETINQITQNMIKMQICPLLPYIDRYEKAWSKLEDFNKRFPGDMQKSVLQMAIQGKLVEQRPEEGTGEELYRQIQAEKQSLIKSGKIKKEKQLPEITEDEIPFDIPESWMWVRFADIALFENGDRSKNYPVELDYVNAGIPFFGAKDIEGDKLSFEKVRFISLEKYNQLGRGKLQDNDFICLLRGSVGKCAVFNATVENDTGFICAQMVIIRCIDKKMCNYIRKYVLSPFYTLSIQSKTTGTAVKQLPAKELSKMIIPLPPLAEQKRIVQKLEEILPLCERLK